MPRSQSSVLSQRPHQLNDSRGVSAGPKAPPKRFALLVQLVGFLLPIRSKCRVSLLKAVRGST